MKLQCTLYLSTVGVNLGLFLAIFTLWAIPVSFAISDELAVRCLVGEASGEGKIGMQAVGEVLRVRDSVGGFYGCNAKHVDSEPEYVWAQAKEAWRDSEFSNITNSATHFESINFKPPYWAKGLKIVAIIGKQRFYR